MKTYWSAEAEMCSVTSGKADQFLAECVVGWAGICKGLYVVEVVVKSWTNDILFSTSKGEVYIKTEGGKKKLVAYGIQEELRGRLEGF